MRNQKKTEEELESLCIWIWLFVFLLILIMPCVTVPVSLVKDKDNPVAMTPESYQVIIKYNCLTCHGREQTKGGLNLELWSSYGLTLRKSHIEEIVRRMTTSNPSIQMPPVGSRPSSEDVEVIRSLM